MTKLTSDTVKKDQEADVKKTAATTGQENPPKPTIVSRKVFSDFASI